MNHQDWNTVTFKTQTNQTKKTSFNKTKNPDEFVLEAPPNLGKTISQARLAKNMNQKELSAIIGISSQILARWESGKENPTNAQIAKIEKQLGIKLPRCKKVNIE